MVGATISPRRAARPESVRDRLIAMRLAVLTGGGDVPGLNPCIKALVTRVRVAGHEVVGVGRGWAGLLECNADDEATLTENVRRLDLGAVRTIDRTGGTVLHTSRTNPGNVRPKEVPAFLADRASGDGPF